MSAEVDTIIVAHDSGDLLIESVASVAAEVGEDRVWIVDAESADGSVDAVRARFPGVHVLPVLNRGFSAGNNRGIEATGSPFVFMLNPDAIVAPGTVAALQGAMEAEPRAGIVAPVVRNADGTVQPASYGRFPSLWLRVQAALQGNQPPSEPDERVAVDWVTGAAMLVRRAAIADAGPMDEEFFLYYEDVEWCHRMWDHGWRVLIDPAGSVVHHVGGSGGSLAEEAYRRSFERYCDLYGLWGLKFVSRAAVAVRRLFGGRA